MRSGERCSACGVGKMHVDTVRTVGQRRTRYLRCTNEDCRRRGKEVISIDDLGRPLYAATAGSTPQPGLSKTLL
jgi:hypothetical protein